MREAIIWVNYLLAAVALPTALNASGFWLLTTPVKKTAAFKEYFQEFKPWLKSVGVSLVMKDSDLQIVEGRGGKLSSLFHSPQSKLR